MKIQLLTLTHHEIAKNNKVRLDGLNFSLQKIGIEQFEVADLFNNSWDNIMEVTSNALHLPYIYTRFELVMLNEKKQKGQPSKIQHARFRLSRWICAIV